KSYSETLTVETRVINLPKDKILTIDDQPKLNITVKTYGFYLFGSYFYDKSIEVDLEKDAYIDKNSYIWLANRALPQIEKQFSKGFEILTLQPDTLKFPFGILSSKKVPITLKSNINYAFGYNSLEGLVLVPDSITVIGTDAEIKTINNVETAELKLLDIKENINQKVNLKLPDNSSALKLSQEQISVSAEIEKFTEGTLEIPVIINNLPSDVQINYFPKKIKVSYEVSLDQYKSIKPTDFKIECDFLEIKSSNASYFTPRFKRLPSNVKHVKMKQNKIEYIITE
ncbi:YbbR-like domain-containing protein, partial [Psychroserpens sp.]|uniref:CdaR family protein n=1 Tax=Psychroserpens sp. TaxID=2020870 RepID=UPI003859316B